MTPTNHLSLNVVADGRSTPLDFRARRVVNAGYVGRDQAAVRAHIEELSREGVPPPASVPVLLPVGTDRLTTGERIEVIGGETSGEVEYVLLLDQGQVLVGVGSDHTDRALERSSLAKSKQICSNVLSRQVWRYQDVRDRWDVLQMQSWVRTSDGTEVPYQRASLSSILSADELIDLVRSNIKDGQHDGLVIFSGTLPLLAGKMIYSDAFRCELIDPQSSERLACEYQVIRLNYLEAAP